jgi:hypothetical protein
VVQNRGASQTCRLERVAGCAIIGARRIHSAHLHRPWRATSEYAIDARRRRFRASSRPDFRNMASQIERSQDAGAAAVVPVVCRSGAGRRQADGSRSDLVRCCGLRTRERTWPYRRELTQFGNSGDKIGQTVAVARYIFKRVPSARRRGCSDTTGGRISTRPSLSRQFGNHGEEHLILESDKSQCLPRSGRRRVQGQTCPKLNQVECPSDGAAAG